MSRLRRLALVVLAFGSLGRAAPGTEAHKLKVLTSFLPVYCFTANVAGDLAEVENLLPGNVEPHDYQFSRKDLQKLAQADLIVINGLGLEKWLDKAVQNSAASKAMRVVELADGLDAELIYATAQATNSRRDDAAPTAASQIRRLTAAATLANPHIWLDPRLARHAVRNILKALQQADPAHASGYATNATRYLGRLEQLDLELEQALAPLRGAAMVTYHDAFAYFARHYGLKVVGVIEPVPDIEPSLKHLAFVYRAARANQVQAIFTEPPTPSRLARQIGSDLHLPLAELDTLETGSLTPVAYEESIRSNLRVLLKTIKPDAQRNPS